MYREPHPYVCAYVLAGEPISRLAYEVGVSKYKAGRWLRGEPVAEGDLKRLWPSVAAVVMGRYRELSEKLKRDPALKHDKRFRDAVDDLNLAHQLCFGQSLIDFILDAQQTGIPSHIPPERLEFFQKQQGWKLPKEDDNEEGRGNGNA